MQPANEEAAQRGAGGDGAWLIQGAKLLSPDVRRLAWVATLSLGRQSPPRGCWADLRQRGATYKGIHVLV